ncbi:hypothetical protein MCOR28_003540 [Pyricularia oryzae]|nr:hypothetical protein MCOR26_002076 [Pyricularia oryzae]KAI6345470.1 hypothetical protein MCOR28_003540 [Pyricularia oryzae]
MAQTTLPTCFFQVWNKFFQICPTHKHRLGSPANSVAGGIVSPQPAQGYGRLCLLPSRHNLQKLLFVTNCLSKGKAARAGPPCGVTGGLC